MEATFRALRGRIKGGPDFRGRFIVAFAREMQVGRKLQAEADDIKVRIDRLMQAVERGIDTEHVTERILALQEELDQVRANIRAEAMPRLPAEAEIRSVLLREVGAIEISGDIERQRVLFKCVLDTITLRRRFRTAIAVRRSKSLYGRKGGHNSGE